MKYKTKTVLIEAVQFTGGKTSAEEVKAFAGGAFICWWFNHDCIGIKEPVGVVSAKKGDWVIKDKNGFHVCQLEVFNAKYESAE